MSAPLIVRQDDLQSFVARAKASPVLALDTEFVWTRTYYAGLGLIQAATLDETVLIDPLAVTDLSPLRTLNESPDIVKIFHDPEMDLPILARGGCGRARNVFDTRTSAGFGGLPSIWSLGKLLCELTGIDLPKTEARTDWLARPLSDKQLSYAADDVHHMARMRDLLLQRARERGNEAWLNEEMLRWEQESLYADRDPRKAFRSVKGMGRLKHRQKAVLRELAAWRETTGKEHDITRNRIMRDEILLIVANFSPTTD
ncbi:MAG: HRDC domain-containing protein, partial [Lentisphaeria bacterium]|nr:HRDC domain-containing protein [Lentisphaeria bacterium]